MSTGLGSHGPDVRFPSHSGGLGHVDREPSGDGRQEGLRFHDVPTVGVLPPQPGFLEDVFGLHGTAEYAVGDTEQLGRGLHELPGRSLERIGVVFRVHGGPFPPGSSYNRRWQHASRPGGIRTASDLGRSPLGHLLRDTSDAAAPGVRTYRRPRGSAGSHPRRRTSHRGVVTVAGRARSVRCNCLCIEGIPPWNSRVNYFGNALAGKVMKHLNSASKVVADSTLPATTQELVKIRASQINGCGFCTDMHTKDATARRRDRSTSQPGRGLARGQGLHRRRARRPGDRRAGHPHRRRRRWCHRRGLGERRQALRRGPTRRADLPDRHHQRLQPHQRHHPAARRRLPARPVRLRRSGRAGPHRPSPRRPLRRETAIGDPPASIELGLARRKTSTARASKVGSVPRSRGEAVVPSADVAQHDEAGQMRGHQGRELRCPFGHFGGEPANMMRGRLDGGRNSLATGSFASRTGRRRPAPCGSTSFSR